MSSGKLLVLRYRKKLMALLMEKNRLLSVKVYEEDTASLVGNIYIGKVQSIAENINAAFVEIADRQLCFLPLSDAKIPHLINRDFDGRLHAGDELVVQVLRDAVKTKQPVLTTKLSLAGNYLAVSSGSSTLGISAKLSETKKKEITDFLLAEGLLDKDYHCLSEEG
ncbi:MAG: ribonuclease E/G, partial [Lachnospiraceae bacterium]